MRHAPSQDVRNLNHKIWVVKCRNDIVSYDKYKFLSFWKCINSPRPDMCGFFVNARFDLVVGVTALQSHRRHFRYFSSYLKIRSCSLSRSPRLRFLRLWVCYRLHILPLVCQIIMTVEPRYNDTGLYDTSPIATNLYGRLRLKCEGTRAETRFRLSAKRTSPFKSAGASVQSTTGSRGMRISGSNAGYTMFRGSVKGTGYPLHSPVSPSLPLPCVTVCHHISTGLNLATLT
jgi:hypothetical protein